MDDPDVYSNFLKLLTKARKKDWSPGKVRNYIHIVYKCVLDFFLFSFFIAVY